MSEAPAIPDISEYLSLNDIIDHKLQAENRGDTEGVRYWQDVHDKHVAGQRFPRSQISSTSPPMAIGTKKSDKILHSKADFTYWTDSHKERPKAPSIADYIHTKYSTVSFNKQVYIYDGEKGIYRPDNGEIAANIQKIIDEVLEYEGAALPTRREVTAHLQGMNVFSDYPFNAAPGLIPLKNCCVQYDTKTGGWISVERSSKHRFTYRIPVDYLPHLDTEPVDNLFRQWVNEDDCKVLYIAPAQALLQAILREPYKKAYLLKGEKNSAKSSYLELLRIAFSDVNISRVSLQQLSRPFALAPLEGKLLNIYDDLSNLPLKDYGAFKMITGLCSHQIELKHQTPYNGFITAVHIFTCNEPPLVGCLDDEAFWNRWGYIVFPNYFETDPGFYARTFTPDFIQRFMVGVLREAARMLQAGGLTITTSLYETREKWMYSTNPMYRFVQETYDRDRTGKEFIETQDLYRDYQEWCDKDGVSIQSQDKFTKTIPTFGFCKSRLNNKHGYKGFARKITQAKDSKQDAEPINPFEKFDNTSSDVGGEYES